jgi:hypothetical protein
MLSANDLRQQLRREHHEEHLFRGQTQVFPGPLWPSDYNNFLCADDNLVLAPEIRLRGTGTHFRLRMTEPRQAFATEEARLRHVRQMQAKWFIMDHVRNALGYALSETFFQHAGLRSQVLDVTTDIDVAFFFATHGYRNGRYYRLPDDGSPRQIYRWRFPRRTWSLHSLNQYDYNTSPPVIPVAEILRLFKPCDTAAEFERSLEDYRKAIGWGPTFDLDSVRERRPFEIIRMPRELASSRAVSQGAAALAPDVVTPEAFFSRHTSTDPYWRAHIQNGLFVEDLAKNPTCERVEFDAGGVERQDLVRQAFRGGAVSGSRPADGRHPRLGEVTDRSAPSLRHDPDLDGRSDRGPEEANGDHGEGLRRGAVQLTGIGALRSQAPPSPGLTRKSAHRRRPFPVTALARWARAAKAPPASWGCRRSGRRAKPRRSPIFGWSSISCGCFSRRQRRRPNGGSPFAFPQLVDL